MNGYIEYNDISPLSPMYSRSISIGDTVYESPDIAIRSGEDPQEVIFLLVRDYRNIYYTYRNYTFKGTYSDLLNTAIQTLYIPRKEPANIDKYMYILDTSIYRQIENLPIELSIPIIRNVYVTENISENLYKQVRVLDTVEIYNVYIIDDTPLYVGAMGAFLLLNEMTQDISSILSKLI